MLELRNYFSLLKDVSEEQILQIYFFNKVVRYYRDRNPTLLIVRFHLLNFIMKFCV